MPDDKNTYKIFIATPCYNGMCHSGYTISLLKTFGYFQAAKNVKLVHKFILYESLVPRARNHFIAYALSDPEVTHILFVDSDMKWEPTDLAKMIAADKPIIGAASPKKRYHWDKLRSDAVRELVLNDQLTNEEFRAKIKANLVEYAINFGDSREVKGGLIEVGQIGTAFMLISRFAIMQMIEAYPELRVQNPSKELPEEARKHMYCLFELGVDKEGEYYSEDYSFCRRFTQLGGKVYADLSINLGHQGQEDFEGNFLSLANIQRTTV
ncbi:MAG: hypothetical protein AB7I18_06140 [Candidatus Berkiella sp.]